MAKLMSKAELIQAIADEHSDKLTRQDVKGVLKSLATVGYKQLRKSGEFLVPGFAKFRVIKKPATKKHNGINPFTKEPMIFKAKLARNILRARPVKARPPDRRERRRACHFTQSSADQPASIGIANAVHTAATTRSLVHNQRTARPTVKAIVEPIVVTTVVTTVVPTVVAAVIAAVDRVAPAVGSAMDANAASAADGDNESGMCRIEWHGLGGRNTDDADAEDKAEKLTHLLILMAVIDVGPTARLS